MNGTLPAIPRRKTIQVWIDKQYSVYITLYPNRKAFLYAARHRRSPLKTARGKGALYCYYKDISDGILGEIHFYPDRFQAPTIAHECSHAVMHYLKVKKVNPKTKDGDETLASEIGYLVETIIQWKEELCAPSTSGQKSSPLAGTGPLKSLLEGPTRW